MVRQNKDAVQAEKYCKDPNAMEGPILIQKIREVIDVVNDDDGDDEQFQY